MPVEVNWQTTRPSIRERTKFMFNNDLFSDVKFEVRNGDGESESKLLIPAHKFVLSIGSPVFEAMFYGELSETGGSIELPDCEYESLLELFRYMYSDEVNLSGNNVMGVLYLAKKYMVPSLSENCWTYLQDNLNASNVFSILPMADKCEEKEIVDHCWDVIDEQTEAVVNSDDFVTIERPILEAMVQRDTLKIEEVVLFQAVDLWATKQCEKQNVEANGKSKRKILGEEIIEAIRFPVMTEQEFATVVLEKDILSHDEMKRLFQFFSSASTSSVGFPQKIRFGTLSRRRRFESVDAEVTWLYEDGKVDYLVFTVDKSITLHGLCLCGSRGGDYTVTVALWLVHFIELQFETQRGTFSSRLLNYKGNNYYGYQVFFNSDVNLQKNMRYLIEASIVGPPSCKGVDGNAIVQSSGVTFNFQTKSALSRFKINLNNFIGLWPNVQRTDELRGQFSEFLFSVKG